MVLVNNKAGCSYFYVKKIKFNNLPYFTRLSWFDQSCFDLQEICEKDNFQICSDHVDFKLNIVFTTRLKLKLPPLNSTEFLYHEANRRIHCYSRIGRDARPSLVTHKHFSDWPNISLVPIYTAVSQRDRFLNPDRSIPGSAR